MKVYKAALYAIRASTIVEIALGATGFEDIKVR